MNEISQEQGNPVSQDIDKCDDAVDPRVQIELEKLNTATDDINKLEVDLDEARATFRELLCESTVKIDALAKKLGSCIEKSRPYYDARFRAKQALLETQKAACKFERANSQHAAAKEMVYLAEEGLKTEGRCFDHAWQEMLNHATSRVNESEHERAVCEVEHRRTTALYHKAEYEVQRLQRDLKRPIAKSRPYYEMKAHFNQVLEQQKKRVGALEKAVTDAKMTYAEALRSLERISDEIHKTRKCDGSDTYSKKVEKNNNSNAVLSTDSSGTTGSPDSIDYMSDEYLQMPEKLSTDISEESKNKKNRILDDLNTKTVNLSSSEPRRYIKRQRPKSIASTDAKHIENNTKTVSNILSPIDKMCTNEIVKSLNGDRSCQNKEEWTEINLKQSPDCNSCLNESDDESNIPYKQLGADLSPETSSSENQIPRSIKKLITQKSLPTMTETSEMTLTDDIEFSQSPFRRKSKIDSCIATWISRGSITEEMSTGSSENSSRRQSLDILWNSGTSERVKEFLNQGMMMLSISNLTDKRSNESKSLENEKENNKKVEPHELKGIKVPSPLEKTLNYLHVEDETSDNESLTSIEMLSEDQISSLMMEPDINRVCQEVLGTPLVEVCPMFQQ